MLSRIGTILIISSAIAIFGRSLAGAQSARPAKTAASKQDPQQLFAAGERALADGNLDAAERSFQQVLVLNPRVAGAYANLGVIHMRRKQWESALTNLHQAEKLAPQLPGIRLNIGLAHYRRGRLPARHPCFRIGP